MGTVNTVTLVAQLITSHRSDPIMRSFMFLTFLFLLGTASAASINVNEEGGEVVAEAEYDDYEEEEEDEDNLEDEEDEDEELEELEDLEEEDEEEEDEDEEEEEDEEISALEDEVDDGDYYYDDYYEDDYDYEEEEDELE